MGSVDHLLVRVLTDLPSPIDDQINMLLKEVCCVQLGAFGLAEDHERICKIRARRSAYALDPA